MPLVSGSACTDALQAAEPSLRLRQLSAADAARAALSGRVPAAAGAGAPCVRVAQVGGLHSAPIL